MLLGFQKQFVPLILNGSKGFTLRDAPKRKPEIYEKLHMYTGLRTKQCELITKEHNLLGVEEVSILIRLNERYPLTIWVNGGKLTVMQTDMFCVMDGFRNPRDFVQYWAKGLKTKEFETSKKMFRWVELPF